MYRIVKRWTLEAIILYFFVLHAVMVHDGVFYFLKGEDFDQ